MLFTLVERFASIPPVPRQAFLVRDAWNDYGYVTMFQLKVVDDQGRMHDIGNIKVGRFGAPEGWAAAPELAGPFTALTDQYFSLGQDDTYYENLANLGAAVRIEVLSALRDLAEDPGLLARAQSEDVTTVSLLRSVTVQVVTGQFRRIVHGGERVTPYEFGYQPAPPAVLSDPVWRQHLDFTVIPDQQPPTNVHVVIGRNGVGKSHLLRNLVRVVADRRVQPAEVGRVIGDDLPGGGQLFLGVVAVSFSAFDEFVAIPEEHQRVPYLPIGAHDSSGGEVEAPLSRAQFAELFAESLEQCLTGRAAERWVRAVDALRYSGSGFLDDDDWVPRFWIASAEQRRTMALQLFSRLSSGHAIVLLIITRLVERVQARTLVVIDEPESHLHPPLLAAFVWALSALLVNRNSVAVIATHSPVVLQEVPASCVWTIRKNGRYITPERPVLETFGENVGTLTHEVFSLEVTDSGYHRVIRSAVLEGLRFNEILARFGGRLGNEARAITRTLIAIRDAGGEL